MCGQLRCCADFSNGFVLNSLCCNGIYVLYSISGRLKRFTKTTLLRTNSINSLESTELSQAIFLLPLTLSISHRQFQNSNFTSSQYWAVYQWNNTLTALISISPSCHCSLLILLYAFSTLVPCSQLCLQLCRVVLIDSEHCMTICLSLVIIEM